MLTLTTCSRVTTCLMRHIVSSIHSHGLLTWFALCYILQKDTSFLRHLGPVEAKKTQIPHALHNHRMQPKLMPAIYASWAKAV